MYAIDRRKVAVQMYSILQSLRKVAILLTVSHSTVSRWLQNPIRRLYPKRTSKVDQVIGTITPRKISNADLTTLKHSAAYSVEL